MISQGSGNKTDQPIFSCVWGSGFLPSEHQGVRLRAGKDPVPHLSNPAGVDAGSRRRMLDPVGRSLQDCVDRTAGPHGGRPRHRGPVARAKCFRYHDHTAITPANAGPFRRARPVRG
jgi:hypothetical protein